jgi:ribosomal protein S18 acetylase RimI-like enzyme
MDATPSSLKASRRETLMNQDQPEMVRLAQRCLIEVLKETARRCDGVAMEQRGLFLVAGNHPCPVFVNSVLRTGVIGASEVLSRAATFFSEIENQYELWTRDGVDEDLENAAKATGMRFAAELIGMVLHRAPELPDPVHGIELHRVEDAQGVREFTDVAAEGFRGEAPGMSELVRAIFSDPRALLADDTAGFVAWDRGEPVSAAMTMVKEGVAWIGWVATRPEARGRGLGRLTTAAATRTGFELGAKFASLEATKMGVPVYSRLGFREILRYRNYWPKEVK